MQSHSSIPYGFCHCGCGEKTNLAGRMHKRFGYTIGEPLKFLSHHSYAKPLDDRFWAKVDKNGPVPAHCPELGPCWIFTGAKSGGGYGTFRAFGAWNAHVVSWILHYGPVPKGMNVLHRCDTRPCIRPTHLFLGTKLDNALDRIAKGRPNKGAAKLTETQVREIRAAYRPVRGCVAALARQYNMVSATISHIIGGRNWKHI